MHSIRVICIDSYQAVPIQDVDPTFSQFRGADIKQVPVLRIFGITLEGEKVCLHVHGVFPYLYVPYAGQINADVLAYRLAIALDTAINISLGSSKANSQHIYKIQQVSGIPFYGYHEQKHHFLKIYFYNPAFVKRATDLLQNGSILEQIFQPHEAHIPFTLQFMIDYNIYGMSMINIKHVKYRHCRIISEHQAKSSINSTIDNFETTEKEYLPYTILQQSVCNMEMDAWASDILNREVIDKGIDLNPGIAAIWEEEKVRRAQAGLEQESQLTYPKSPERLQAACIATDIDVYQQSRLAQRLYVIESQDEENSLSNRLKDLSYPVPVLDNSNLLNASQLEIHAGPPNLNSLQKSQHQSNEIITNESIMHQFQLPLNDTTLDHSDFEIVDMLVELAKDQVNSQNSIDSNSILGTQQSQQNNFDAESEGADDEEDIADLNLTSIELDSLNLSSWEVSHEKPQSKTNEYKKFHTEFSLESLNDLTSINVSDNIPQLDGPVDNENIVVNEKDTDLTIERHEFVICEYKQSRKQKRSTSVTPSKRKRPFNSYEDQTGESLTVKKMKTTLPKTPQRTPSKRSSKITSPCCPSRTYSPLSVEITSGLNTPNNSPSRSPLTRSVDRKKMKENLYRKRIFSPVKEMTFEERQKNCEKLPSKDSHELFNSDNDTLVEDSDDSSQTILPSTVFKPVIINETDSNDTTCSKDKFSSLSPVVLSNLETVFEDEPIEDFELSFTPSIQSRTQRLFKQSYSSSPQQVSEKLVTVEQKNKPPIVEYNSSSFDTNISRRHYICPFFSNEEDSKEHSKKQGTIELERKTFGINDLSDDQFITIRPLKPPPDRKSVEAWVENWKKQKESKKNKPSCETLENKVAQKSFGSDSIFSNANLIQTATISNVECANDSSKHLGISCGQIECNTRTSIGDIRQENLQNAKALATYQFLTILCLEVHVITRPNMLPDPCHDTIQATFYAIQNDIPPDWNKTKPLECGMIIVDPSKLNSKLTTSNFGADQRQSVIYVESEEALFQQVLVLVRRTDPEILIGWDLEFLSWGYLFQRALVLGKNLSQQISRIPSAKCYWESAHDKSTTELNLETLGEVKLIGRIVLNIWRIMRHEIAITSYSYESVMFHVMNERIPYFSFDILTKWWQSHNNQWRIIDHYTNKVIGVHRILHHLDIINRTSEHARLYGIQFYEVFSRGSQFRVESMMLRLAKPMNYIPVSPSSHQRGCMRAPESLPLIMEPESTMYCDPVIVLDFQSLYPSIIIAYNYCFSTCLGRVEHIGSSHPFEFGATTLKVSKRLVKKLQKKINIAPCGVAFVKKEIRDGVLPRMLREILETRLMVKKAIKDHSKEDRALQRALDSRQLGLKLIANVTYGYTAANFSGRMPCIEIGDSVVSKGKETLERAIKMVESTSKWGARVVYGDTDSLFVLVKGKSREEAFNIGTEIAEAVTAANPKPVKLKFEKVLQPCILQTKKRYCGYMYENLNDKPVYLAKGIETVRRDGCPAVTKILEKSLKILFDTKDLSLVKEYFIRQLDKILTGKASIHDLTFAKEFRGMRGYKPTACVPALELTKRLIQKDPRAVPRTGDRVPYIIVAGAPNEPLIKCVRAPMELLTDQSLRPNAVYYVTKVIIPPLNRCLNLIGVDSYTWYMEMPHRQTINRIQGVALLNTNRKQKRTISQYLCNTTCPSCGQSCDKGICSDCIKEQSQTLVTLHEKCRQYDRIYSNIKMICQSCIGVMDADSCTSLDCPIFYRRIQAQRDNTQVSYLYDLIQCLEHLT